MHEERARMVREQVESRGVRDERVLDAMRSVPRERFLDEELRVLACHDATRAVGADQVVAEPHLVAFMVEQLEISGRDRVLEIGTGSGYVAAVLADVAGEVYTVERDEARASRARDKLERFGIDNVEVLCGDGSRGWSAHAPYDAILVEAGVREIPAALRDQLAIGGRLLIPIGATPTKQLLVRVERVSERRFEERELLPVRFAPLIGEEGWKDPEPGDPRSRRGGAARDLWARVAESCEPFDDLEDADLDPLLARIGDARVVLLGGSTHGTSEFYRMRTRITRALVEKRGFTVLALQADWPAVALVDRDVRFVWRPSRERTAFTQFPTWMWRNHEVRELIDALREFNRERAPEARVAVHGLDLYSLHASIEVVLDVLAHVDPSAEEVARERYAQLTPWLADAARDGHDGLMDPSRSREDEAVEVLLELLGRRLEHASRDAHGALDEGRGSDTAPSARTLAEAEGYYRAMYRGGARAWSLREAHMFETLRRVMSARGEGTRAVVWAHNAHGGDASATEMGARGATSLGQLCREHFGDGCYAVGFGTDHGTVAAARAWGAPMQVMRVRPSHTRSYEEIFHATGIDRFFLPLRPGNELRSALLEPRLERAIGVVYRPEAERVNHYFMARLPAQFDELVWFDESRAVHALDARVSGGATYPFGPLVPS